jgi:cell division protein FtsW (lipid II flippase)
MLIVGQACLNMMTVLGLAPLTGVGLPFMSYGSTSLITTLAAMGLLLNIASLSASSVSDTLERKRGTRPVASHAAPEQV